MIALISAGIFIYFSVMYYKNKELYWFGGCAIGAVYFIIASYDWIRSGISYFLG